MGKLQINREAVASMKFKDFEKAMKPQYPALDLYELYKANGGKDTKNRPEGDK